jgi:hypothetical protein
MDGVTTISIVAFEAHCPAAGVKVYVTVPGTVVFIAAGIHVPVIAGVFDELPGKAGAMLF